MIMSSRVKASLVEKARQHGIREFDHLVSGERAHCPDESFGSTTACWKIQHLGEVQEMTPL